MDGSYAYARAQMAQVQDPELGPTKFIYALIDPETEQVRYIGKSIRPIERLHNHMNGPRKNCHRSHWLQSLKSRGLWPDMVILEGVAGEWPWQEAERFWIARGRAMGWPLTNNTDGGDGVEGLPAETRAKMAATWTGRKHRPESLEKMRLANLGRKGSEAKRQKLSAAHKGRKIMWVDKIREANSKFTREKEAGVRARLAAGARVLDIAREFGVHRTTVSKIKAGTYRVLEIRK